MKRSYARLGLLDFSRALLDTADLDPVYVALWRAELRREQLARWLLAYWMYYHAGVASRLSEHQGGAFWEQAAGGLACCPRGRERRHFRGAEALRAVHWLARHHPQPESAVEMLLDMGDGVDFLALSAQVQRWPMFGPWIAFKVGDMLERLGLLSVNFDAAALSMYEAPKEGAALAVPHLVAQGRLGADHSLTAVCGVLLRELHGQAAPPRYERALGLQECETMLCKWKSHIGGHYPVGIDTLELKHALVFDPTDTSQRLVGALSLS